MKYVGLQHQISSNNRKTAMLLILFPVIILVTVFAFLVLCQLALQFCGGEVASQITINWDVTWEYYTACLPYVIGGVALWFTIAYFSNTAIIRYATGAKSVERKDNLRVYNIVENLCIAGGIEMPKINIVNDPGLNAFASGINIQTYTVTLTTGIIEKLNDAELSAVIAHELTHIKNRDTRLLIISIIFVGILATIATVSLKMVGGILRGSGRRRSKKGGGGAILIVLLVAVICSSVAYLFASLTRFAISRSREYVADAGGVELCGDSLALASALRKVSDSPGLRSVNREDIAQLYIIHPRETANKLLNIFNGLFSTHPDTEERIRLLEQF